MSLASSLRPSRQATPFTSKTVRSSRQSARNTPPSGLDIRATPNFTLYGAPAPRSSHRTVKGVRTPSKPTPTPIGSPHDVQDGETSTIPRLDFSALRVDDDDDDDHVMSATTDIAEVRDDTTILPEPHVNQESLSESVSQQVGRNVFDQSTISSPIIGGQLNQLGTAEKSLDHLEPVKRSMDQSEPVKRSMDQSEPIKRSMDQLESIERSMDQLESVERSMDQSKISSPIKGGQLGQQGPAERSLDQLKPVERSYDQLEGTNRSVDNLEKSTTEESTSDPVELSTTYSATTLDQSLIDTPFGDETDDQSQMSTPIGDRIMDQSELSIPVSDVIIDQPQPGTPFGDVTTDQSLSYTPLGDITVDQSHMSTPFGNRIMDQSDLSTPFGDVTMDQSLCGTLDASSMSIAAFSDHSSSACASSCVTSGSWSARSCSSLPRDAATPAPYDRRRAQQPVESGYYSPDPSELRMSVAEVLEAADCAHRLAHLLDHALGRELGVAHSGYASIGRGSNQSLEPKTNPKDEVPVAPPPMPHHEDTCHCCGPRVLYFSPLDLQEQRAKLKKPLVGVVEERPRGDGDLREVLKKVLMRRRGGVSPHEDLSYSPRSQWSVDGTRG